ncbi:hypothetical protein O3Q51_17095 [Cryomorphaceae bacterium 1068]|nr:hypothetical protein [Cryomorphaceae bacterium 1068]
MKQFGLFASLLLLGSTLFGQAGVYDRDFKRPPSIDLDHLDSVKEVRISETWAGAMSREPIKKPGFLDIVAVLDTAQRLVSFDQYNPTASEVTDSYQFLYATDGKVRIEQVYSSTPKSHQWILRDSLLQEVKLLKGTKKKLKAHWIYTYRDDTLITSIVKYDKNGYVKYQYDYEYSEENQLTRKTIAERGKPTRWLEATYDDEGNLVGYRNDDDRKSQSGSQVAIVRDSSDQVSFVSYQSRRGENLRWEYEYNEAELLVKATLINAEGKEERCIEYLYDTEGNEVRKTIIEKKKEKQRRDLEYDEKGNVTAVRYYRRFMGNLDLTFYYFYTYDEAGRLIKKDYWNKDYGQRKRWDYEYVLY